MQTITIKEAENVLKEIMNEEDDRFQLLMKDDRKGVQKLVLKVKQLSLTRLQKHKQVHKPVGRRLIEVLCSAANAFL